MKNGKSGFLIEKGDSQKLIEHLRCILNNPKDMGEIGWKFVMENFSWENVAKQFINDVKYLLK